jgi:hypothetical protein
MLSPKILLAVIIAIIAIGAALLVFQWWILGGILTALGLALLFFWWRLNQILQISDALLKNDLDLARKRLDAVKNPEKLNPYSKTYYYFFDGMVLVSTNKFKEARSSFRTALDVNRFRSVDERATALMMMAQLDLRTRNREGAKRYIAEARALRPSAQVMEQLESVVRQARQGGIRL